MHKGIALFDFDGTITDRDIFFDFILYRLKNGLGLKKIVLATPTLFLYLVRVYDNETAKQIIFSILFKNENETTFAFHALNYSNQILPHRIRKKAAQKIQDHLDKGERVIIVSANFDIILKYIAAVLKLEVICTRVDVLNGIITGRFSTPNCYGNEKVKRIKALIPNLDSYENIYAYGDSKGDKEMLKIATEKFYRHF